MREREKKTTETSTTEGTPTTIHFHAIEKATEQNFEWLSGALHRVVTHTHRHIAKFVYGNMRSSQKQQQKNAPAKVYSKLLV